MATKKTKTIDLKCRKEVHFYCLNTFGENSKHLLLYSHKSLTRPKIILRAFALGMINDNEQKNCAVCEISLEEAMQYLNPMSYVSSIDIETYMFGTILDENYENYDAHKHWDFMRGV